MADQRTIHMIKVLINKPALTKKEENLLTNYILRYNAAQKIVPCNRNLLQDNIPSIRALSHLIMRYKKYYTLSNQNYTVFKSLALKQNNHDYTLFHILIGSEPVDPNIITYDHFDLLAIHLFNRWSKLNKRPRPTLEELFKFLDSI